MTFSCVVIYLILFVVNSSDPNNHLKTRHFSKHTSAAVRLLTRKKTESLLTCSFYCFHLQQCSGFWYSTKNQSCNFLEKNEDGIGKTVFIEKETRGCGKPQIKNIKVAEEHAMIGQEVEYTCEEGYTLCGYNKKRKVTCMPGGLWSQPAIACHKCVWSALVKGQRNDVNLTCPIKRAAKICILGKIEVFNHDTIVRINISGNGVVVAFLLWPKKNGNAWFELRFKGNASKWKVQSRFPASFKMEENTSTHFQFDVYRKAVALLVNGKATSRYGSRNRLNVDKLTFSSDLNIQNIQVTYRFRRKG